MGTALRQSERLWGGVYALLHFLVLPGILRWLTLSVWVANVCVISLNLVASVLIYRRFLRDSGKAAAQSPAKLFLYGALGLLAYFLVGAVYLRLAATIYPGFSNLNDGQVAAQLSQGGILMAFCVVIAAPVGEECIFRGLLFRGLYDRSPVLAWCLSAGLFALVHVLGYIGLYTPAALVLAFFQYLPAGIVLALAYRLSHNFFCPVLIHICINLIGLFTLL